MDEQTGSREQRIMTLYGLLRGRREALDQAVVALLGAILCVYFLVRAKTLFSGLWRVP